MKTGWSKVLLVLALPGLLLLAGCQEGEGGILQVVAEVDNEASGAVAVVFLLLRDSLLTDATVRVNGQTLDVFSFWYELSMLEIGTGEDVTLDIQRGGVSISKTLVMPGRPTVTAPTTALGPYDAALPLSVAWTLPVETPDEIMVHVSDDYTSGDDSYLAELSPSAVSHQIPGGTLSAGLGSAEVGVAGVNVSSDLGSDASTDSVFMVLNIDESEPFATN